MRRSDIRYWQRAIFREKYSHEGKRRETGNWSVKIQREGRREKFSLGDRDKAAAAEKAREIYEYMQAHGMEKACAQYKSSSLWNAGPIVTVGDLIREVLAIAQNAQSRTVKDYCQKFRRIVADIFDIQEEKKTDYHTGGRDRWVARIESVKLLDITPADIQRWKVVFINRAGTDPTAIASARTSVNTCLRQASSLFAESRIKHLPQPVHNPFKGVEFEPRQDMRYRGGFSIEKLIEDAMKELKPEQLKAFLLASMAGLRREEIDSLQWSAFKWDKKQLSIQRTKYFQPKSNHSLGDVSLDDEVVSMFRGFRAKASSDEDFVMVSEVQPRPGSEYFHYRCDATLDKLTDWLRAKNVPGRSPLHTLRKEFGSRINAEYGIYEASQALRHADIQVTALHYLRNTKRISPGLGHLLTATPGNVVRINEGEAPDRQEEKPPQAVTK